MNTDTFFLVFCLTIVILGIVIAPAAADNTTVTAAPTATATPTGTVAPTATATTAVTATTAATTTATTVATTVPTTVVTTVATTSPTTVTTTVVVAVAPVAAFSASPASGTAPLIVQFTDASTNTPTGWIWSFGDGMGNSTLQNPSYTYANAGTYTVTLTAINSAGSSVTTNSITVSSAAATVTATTVPVPAFYGTPTSGTVPLTVQFTDTSTGSPANWTWDFGDGNTSTLEDPSYTYVSNGTYDVQLIATNAAGSNVTTQTGYIVVGDTVPVTGFSASPTTGTAPLIVGFTDTSSGTPTSWTWDFGDGTTGSDENPSHTYSSEGTYSVSLIASNTAGSNTSVQSDYIEVSAATDVTTTVTTEVTSTDSDTPAPVSTYVVPVPTQQVSVSSPASSGSGKSATSTDAWLAEENQKMAAMDAETTATPQQTDIVSSIVGFFESLFSWI